MKYLCLIYDEESKLGTMQKEQADAMMGEYGVFTEGIKKNGHYIGGEALQPTHTATTVRVRHGKTSTTDGPSWNSIARLQLRCATVPKRGWRSSTEFSSVAT